MAMTFHQSNHGMTVMDGKRVVAVARERAHGWLLTLHGASWLDKRARTQGLIPGAYPSLMVVKTRHEAATVMIQLTNTGRNPN